MGIRDRFIKWYVGIKPPKTLRFLSLPLGHELKTTEWFRYERARMVETAFGFVANNEVEGDYAEFGVFEGGTFVEAWEAAVRWSMPMQLHAFDSFQGLPTVTGIDAGGQFATGQYAAEREQFERTLRRRRVDMSRVVVTPGFFADTLRSDAAQSLCRSVAIAWIDCDLYESTVPVLEYLSSRLADGAVVCFDDWFCYKGRNDRGEQLACAEWLQREQDLKLIPYHKFHWAGQSFIVQRD